MIRTALIALIASAAPVLAETKAESCAFQADVVTAVQAARVERVAERNLTDHILATSPAWPEKYNGIIPLVAPWVYEQRRRDLKTQDLGAAWKEICLQQ